MHVYIYIYIPKFGVRSCVVTRLAEIAPFYLHPLKRKEEAGSSPGQRDCPGPFCVPVFSV